MQPILRRATDNDVAAIASLTNSAYEKYVPRIGQKPQPMTTDYQDFVEHHPVWILETAEEMLGVLALAHEQDALLIYSVAIAPPHQKRGLGRLLLVYAEEEAQKAGYSSIRLYTNARMEENIALYIKLGYQETMRESVGNNVRVHMYKQLMPASEFDRIKVIQ